MKSAKFKTLRESLGLPALWLAKHLGVDRRAVHHWESGRNDPPKDAIELLDSLNHNLINISNNAVEEVKEVIESEKRYGHELKEITLIRYKEDKDLWRYHKEFDSFPASYHAMILSRIMSELMESTDVEVKIVYMRPDDYEEWLGDRTDNEELRSLWANEQVK